MNPTTTLPPLGRLSLHSTEQILCGLQNLWDLYFPKPRLPTKLSMVIPKRTIRRPTSVVPDSGYASAEEEEGEGENEDGFRAEDDDEDAAQLLRADPLERAFAVRWITGFVARADTWIEASGSDVEAEERSQIFDEATSLLSAFSGGDEEPEVALTRSFTFSTAVGDCQIQVELNDAPLSNEDHTSVGLQSWGSSILLAERMCASPATFLPVRSDSDLRKRPLRILELGAGTGMLSIVAAKLLRQQCTEADITALQGTPEIIATDYHPDVLANLSVNVSTNFPGTAPIVVRALDWENPVYEAPFDKPFDIILAADVVYHPNHAEWIKKCVERLLVRPTQGSELAGGVFWLFIPVRTTGRHEGMDGTVDALFPFAGSGDGLVILDREAVGRQGGVGRADEGAYKLSKIGWADS